MPSANELSSLIEHDPQMQLPELPKLSDDYLKIWASSQLLILTGGLSDVVLRGKSVSSILPQVLPLLNGRLSIPEICARVYGYPERSVRDVIALLYMRGVLEEGRVVIHALPKEAVRAFKPQLDFYSRYIDVTRSSKNRYEVLDKLQSSHVLLVVDGYAAYQTAHEFINAGVGQLDILNLNDHEDWAALTQLSPFSAVTLLPAGWVENVTPYDLIVFVSGTRNGEGVRRLNKLAHDSGKTLLCALLHPDDVQIGPVYFPQQSPCYECAEIQGALSLDQATASTDTQVGEHQLSPEQHIGVGQVTVAMITILTHLTSVGDPAVYVLSQDTLTWDIKPVHMIAGCPLCGKVADYDHRDLPIGDHYLENLPTFYHINARVRRYDMNPKGHQVHYRDEVFETLKHAHKAYDGCPHIELPQIDVLPEHFHDSYAQTISQPPAPRTTPIQLQDISILLLLAGGVISLTKGDWVFQKRITPSAGNLLSQGLYFANFSVPGLDPGLYYFRQEGFLEQVAKGDFRAAIGNTVMGSETLPSLPAGAILQTSSMARIESKYGRRAFLFSMFDAGVMLHSLQYMSQLLNIQVWQALDFYDDELNTLMGLHTANEFVSYIAYLTL